MMLLEIQRTRRRKLWIVSSLVVLLYACTLDFGVAFLVSRNSNVWKPVRRISEKCNQLIQTHAKIQTKEKSLPKVYSSYDDDGFGDDLENGGEDFEEDMDLTAFANPEEEGAEDGVPLFPEFGTLRKEKKEKFVYQSPMRETNFTDTYLLVGTFPRQLSLAERRNLWVFHMQWVRRTHLLKYIPVEQVESIAAAKCEVAEEFTVLSPDRLSPMAQVMLVKANSSDDVLSYLKKEPFQVMNTIDWQVDTLEEMETYDAEDDRPFELDNDVVSPFLFVSQQKLHVKNEGKFSTLFDNSFEYHNTAATAGLPFAKYGNSSRVSMMFRIRDLKSNKTKGELLVFNAKTHKDALRYLTKDPFAADRDISEKVIPPTVDIKPNSLTVSTTLYIRYDLLTNIIHLFIADNGTYQHPRLRWRQPLPSSKFCRKVSFRKCTKTTMNFEMKYLFLTLFYDFIT